MIESIDIPDLPGYVSIKEAAEMLGVSDKRVYQYIRAGRLPARRVGNILILPIEEVRQFKPSPSGRVRAKAPSWRTYRSRGALLVTDIRVPVKVGQQANLIEKLKAIQKEDNHTPDCAGLEKYRNAIRGKSQARPRRIPERAGRRLGLAGSSIYFQ